MESLIARLEAVVPKLEACAAGAPAGGDEETEEYPSVMTYDTTFNPKMETMMAAAKAIDADLTEMSTFIQNGFTEVRRLILCGARHNKPDDIGIVMKPINDIKAAGMKWCKDHYRCKWVNHLKAVDMAFGILDWAVYGPAAGSFVTESTGAVECYTNKIAMEFRGKDENQMKWVQGLVGALKALPEYISDHHKNGLSWSARASKATGPTGMKGASAVAAAPAAAPAPAPAAAPAPAPAPAPAAAPAKKLPTINVPVRAAKKEPSIRQDRDNLYTVEYFDGSDPVLPENLGIKDIINLFQCKNCTIKIPTKVKGISFLNCEKVTIVLSDIIGVAEFTSCKRLIIFMTGSCKSVTVDKCDNVQINLNESSLDCQITTALSSGMNVDIPDLKEEGNMIEFPVPEQIRVQIRNRQLVHEVYVHE